MSAPGQTETNWHVCATSGSAPITDIKLGQIARQAGWAAKPKCKRATAPPRATMRRCLGLVFWNGTDTPRRGLHVKCGTITPQRHITAADLLPLSGIADTA